MHSNELRQFDAVTPAAPPGFYARIGKRWLDLAGALLGLVLLAPVLVVAALAVWLFSGPPVFFRQSRTGRFGQIFQIVKFRTMTAAPDRGAFPLPSAEDFRITAVGRWLRKTKIDELPQLFNVLIGEMSLVGPRPELPAYTSLYAADYPAMFQLRPGLTSPASIAFSHEEDLLASQQDRSGYYLETILPAKLALDSVYCCKLHLAGDVRLVWRTLAQIFSRHPIPARAGLALPERHEEVV